MHHPSVKGTLQPWLCSHPCYPVSYVHFMQATSAVPTAQPGFLSIEATRTLIADLYLARMDDIFGQSVAGVPSGNAQGALQSSGASAIELPLIHACA